MPAFKIRSQNDWGGGSEIHCSWSVITIYCFQIEVAFKFISSSLNQKDTTGEAHDTHKTCITELQQKRPQRVLQAWMEGEY